MTPGDTFWVILVGLPIWALVVALIVRLAGTRRTYSSIVSPDAYGLPPQGGNQALIESACKESLRRARTRRDADSQARIEVYTRPKLGRWYGA